MGKKRRIIQRIHKFGKKYFAFLDGLDGTRDSQLLSSKLDTMISEINVSDRGNQTMSLQFEGFGPGASAQAAGLEKDRVMYSVDGVEVNANGIQTFAAVEDASEKNNRNNLATTAVAPARSGAGASDVILAPGVHTIAAHILGEGAVAASVEIEFTGDPGLNNSITLISHDGTSKTYSGKTSANAAGRTFGHNNGNETAASTLKDAIENAAGHGALFTVVRDGAKLTITNATVGAAGNRDIVSTLDNVTISNGGKIAGGFDADNTKSKTLSKEFNVLPARPLDGTDLATAITVDNTNGQLDINLSHMLGTDASGSGKRPGEEDVYDPRTGHKDGFKLVVTNKDTGEDMPVKDLGDGAGVARDSRARANSIVDLLDTAMGAGTTTNVLVSFSALSSAHAVLQTISVEKQIVRPA